MKKLLIIITLLLTGCVSTQHKDDIANLEGFPLDLCNYGYEDYDALEAKFDKEFPIGSDAHKVLDTFAPFMDKANPERLFPKQPNNNPLVSKVPLNIKVPKDGVQFVGNLDMRDHPWSDTMHYQEAQANKKCLIDKENNNRWLHKFMFNRADGTIVVRKISLYFTGENFKKRNILFTHKHSLAEFAIKKQLLSLTDGASRESVKDIMKNSEFTFMDNYSNEMEYKYEYSYHVEDILPVVYFYRERDMRTAYLTFKFGKDGVVKDVIVKHKWTGSKSKTRFAF
jgi:hypothetical protein